MDDPRFDAEQVRMLRTIDRNSLQLLRVAEDLLADPGGGHGLRVDFVDTDVTTIATHAVEAMHAAAARQQTEIVLLAGGPLLVHGDPSRLHQLLDNLLSNGVKFTGYGGRVCLYVAEVGRYAQLDVLDNGPGIPPAEREQLFERFYRLASSTDQGIPGSGLGLAIAKSVVEAHDGTIEIVDTPGWSTDVRVLLPLADVRTPVVPDTAAPLAVPEPLGVGDAGA
jgi:signal transduction histidine kinase